MIKHIFNEKEAAEYMGMSRAYLRLDRMEGEGVRNNRTPGPAFIRIGRTIRYLKQDLDDWLRLHRVDR